MTNRDKKIIKAKLDRFTPEKMAEAWKVNFNRKLSEDEDEQFEMLRKEYKARTGKMLPPNNFKKGK